MAGVVCQQLTRRHAAIGRSWPAFIAIRRGKPRTHEKAVCRIHSGKPSGKVPRSISGVERSHPAFEDDFELCSKSPGNSHWILLPTGQGVPRGQCNAPLGCARSIISNKLISQAAQKQHCGSYCSNILFEKKPIYA